MRGSRRGLPSDVQVCGNLGVHFGLNLLMTRAQLRSSHDGIEPERTGKYVGVTDDNAGERYMALFVFIVKYLA